MLKLCKVAKVKVFFPVMVYVFKFELFQFSEAILEKGLLPYLSGLWDRYRGQNKIREAILSL